MVSLQRPDTCPAESDLELSNQQGASTFTDYRALGLITHRASHLYKETTASTHKTRVLLYSRGQAFLLRLWLLYAVCCGCCMHTTNFKALHTFCFNAPRMYLADLNGMFSWALRHEFQFTNFLSSLMPIAANTRRKIKPYVELRKSKKSN